MQQRIAQPSAHTLARVIIGIILLGVFFFTPVDHSTGPFFLIISIILLVMPGIALLNSLAERGRLRLHESLLVVAIGILVLYSAMILWPAYESGIAWFVGHPKGSFETYHVWYSGQIYPTPSSSMMLLIFLSTLLSAWYLLLPLGVALISAWAFGGLGWAWAYDGQHWA